MGGHQALCAQRCSNRSTKINLLGTTALVAAMVLFASPANAGCAFSGATITCTDDLASGVSYVDTTAYNTLNILSVTGAIQPVAGTPGVLFKPERPDGGNGGCHNYFVYTDCWGGDDGGTGQAITIDVQSAQVITANANGVVGISRGGNGGEGGGGWAAFYVEGGSGGDGGRGGNVTINTSGSIATTGDYANGIVGLSIGGYGGDGGNAYGAGSDGGEGGAAAGGGDVVITSSSTITTDGLLSNGILAQSNGGYGGSGGHAGGIWSDSGGGGRAAPGGTVSVTNLGDITTGGDFSAGIFAQSVGGFGGHGGWSGGLVAFGSSGGSAGDGGEVTVDNSATIITYGEGSYAIFAQSAGGGGGQGGSAGGLVALGAEGSIGGSGGAVVVNNGGSGSLTTYGVNAVGIFAQSVGGGGGDGGNSIGLAAIGGRGSSTSPGGSVTVNNSQAITTNGAMAQAIFAQSIGGGGGNGGFSAGVISIGGSGGGGGDGGVVSVSNSGALTTAGDDASALFAQSVGGGGGNGGMAIAAGYGFSFAMGGSGAAGGIGNAVTINELLDFDNDPAATIITSGDRSHGIQAQSIGGGGGNGGLAVSIALGESFAASVALGGHGGGGGTSGTVQVNHLGTIATSGDQAYGILAQSIGGGGGNGGGAISGAVSTGYSIAFAMGGDAGAGGDGDDVTVLVRGGITTSGDESYGVLAQSIGGGGGNGGYTVSVAGSTGPLALSLGLGGSGDHGGNAGDVTVAIDGTGSSSRTITTYGSGAVAILAQSIGGGGGNGGFSASASASAIALDLALAGSGAGGGAGGDVVVGNSDDIVTYGANASAIFAQSVGGGGGNGGFSAAVGGGVVAGSVAVGGAGAQGGAGGLVSLLNEGNIATYGELSYGIFAQSVGGGGGNGGFALSGALGFQIEDIPGGALAISVGGKGGTGQVSSDVSVLNTGFIGTGGLGAHAIMAQSVGGGGGSGGFAGSVALTIGSGASFGVAVGGSGSTGGDAGMVTVVSGAPSIGLVTAGAGADGILAQSIGGGGGDGGFAFTGAFGFGGDVNVNLAVAIGGHGGTGGTGAEVTVNNDTAITTFGDESLGIVAQSIGGGGGNGGMAISGTIGLAESTGGASVSVGGSGGSGGVAADVDVVNSGAIRTSGYESLGILAQSIGGGGGNGGLALTAQLSGATQHSATLGAAVGGNGGSGNTAGTVMVINQGSIITTGSGAHGIEAQSVGGGGGNGGMAVLTQLTMAGAGSEETPSMTVNMGVTIGGKGGSGGVAGAVAVTNENAIEVSGLSAMGIFAQSIGGGGGNGGGALNAVGVITDSTVGGNRAVNVDVAIGGAGGSGNDAGMVFVVNRGGIVTHGASGYGIFAQSIGGGGGIGGRANTIAMMVTPACTLPLVCTSPEAVGNNWQLGVTVGGGGGAAGDSNSVSVENTGTIVTNGDTSDGIVAQSVGGGGGMGGNGAVGSSGILPFPAETLLIPVGSTKIYQNIQVAVGGNGGSAGIGGGVTVDNSGSITTRGDTSNGIFAQSVGGGGGVGGAGVIGATGMLGIGGKGNSGGDGGDVAVSTRGTAIIETFGAGSNGIFAQSVGGGGGVAGNVNRAFASPMTIPGVGVTIPAINLGIGLAVGQGGGDGGDGGEVAVALLNTSQVVIHGDGVMGIFAQSVGGGGGLLGGLGDSITINGTTYAQVMGFHAGSNGDAGNGGVVTVDVAGAVRSSGNNAIGVLAQSAGGQGTGGDVNVTVGGSVLAAEIMSAGDGTAAIPLRGLGSTAILAQSVGDSANGNVTVTIANAASVIRGGRTGNVTECALYFLTSCPVALQTTRAVAGVGIWVIDGADNSIVNHGLVTTVGGVNDGWAILATDSGPNVILPLFHTQTGGNETVMNFGTVTGSFDLGRGINTFINQAGGILNGGKYAWVGSTAGATNLLQNNGILRPGGASNVFVTQVIGNLTQSATGHYGVDLDLYQTDVSGIQIPGKTADRINVTGTGTDGGNATLAGAVDVGIMHPGSALAGSHTVTILHADNSVTHAGLTLSTPASVVATYHLAYPDTRTVNLDYAIDFSPDGLDLNRNETALGNYINRVTLAQPRVGSPGASPATPMTPLITALFNLPDGISYKAALDELVPQVLTANSIATEFSSLQFADSLMSCHKADGESRYIAEGSCIWLRGSMRGFHSATSYEYFSVRENDSGMALGVQQEITPNLHFGFGVGYEIGTQTLGNGDHSGGTRIQLGGSLKAELERAMLAFSISGGFADYKVQRHIVFPGFTADGAGRQKSDFVAVHGRGSYLFDFGSYYVKPKLDAGITYLSYSEYKESGTASAILVVPGQEHAMASVQPGLEFGMQFSLAGDYAVRPYASVGLLASVNGGAADISAQLAGAPAAAGTFKIIGNLPTLMFDTTAGIELFNPDGFAIQLGGSLQTSGPVTGETGWLKLMLPT